MANDFQNSIASGVGSSRVDLYTTPSATGKRSMIIGLGLLTLRIRLKNLGGLVS